MKTSSCRFPNMSGSDENDWHEDFEHENGNYHNKCVVCGVDFLGYKRRVVCKACHLKFVDKYENLSDKEKTEFLKKQKQIIDEIWENIDLSGKTEMRNMTDWERKVTDEFIDLMFK